MVNRQEHNNRINNNGRIVPPNNQTYGQSQGQLQNQVHIQNQVQPQNKSYNQNYKSAYNQQDVLHSREGNPNRNFHRDRENQPRQYSNSLSSSSRYNYRNRVEETIDDIKGDILRIEKEIELEIKEIKSLKL